MCWLSIASYVFSAFLYGLILVFHDEIPMFDGSPVPSWGRARQDWPHMVRQLLEYTEDWGLQPIDMVGYGGL